MKFYIGEFSQFENRSKNLHEILYRRVLLKSVDTFQFRLKSDKNRGHFTMQCRRVMKYTTVRLGSLVCQN
jgi:hypothetical protein